MMFISWLSVTTWSLNSTLCLHLVLRLRRLETHGSSAHDQFYLLLFVHKHYKKGPKCYAGLRYSFLSLKSVICALRLMEIIMYIIHNKLTFIFIFCCRIS
jgi:hypothetical protein